MPQLPPYRWDPPTPLPSRACSDLDVVTLQDPFAHLHRDADLEATTDGATLGEAYGQIYAQDEHGMGWSVHGEVTTLLHVCVVSLTCGAVHTQ